MCDDNKIQELEAHIQQLEKENKEPKEKLKVKRN